jgi:aspartyl-tRNA(Asn)/glutamyl-tRNA(Gln) amidotransferase subunit C
MMKITREDVIHVADLARLEPDEASIDKFVMQIALILDYVDTLNQVDTEGVNPTSHAISLTNAFRNDEARDRFSTERALSNAPKIENGTFVVPRVIG